MNSEADVSCSIQYVRAGMHHNWVTGLSSLTERCPFYNKSPTYYPHAPLSPILTLLSLLTYFSLTYSLETPFLFTSPESFISTVTLFSLTHRLIATSPPELEKQVHLCIITPNVCSG